MLVDTLKELQFIASDLIDDLTSGEYDTTEIVDKNSLVANLEEVEVYLQEALNSV